MNSPFRVVEQAAFIVDNVMSSTIPPVDTSSAPPPYKPPTDPSANESSGAQPTRPPPSSKSKTSTILAILTPKLTNKKYISTINGSITGSWKIDTSLVVPKILRGSTPFGIEKETRETRPNLRFGTINGAIKVDLTVLGEYDLDQRAMVSIVLGTVNGKINCAILDRADKSLDLRITSINGPIRILLPLNFSGSLAFNSTKGCVTFSENVQARLDTPLRSVLSGTGTIAPPPPPMDKNSMGSYQFNDSLRFSTINGPVSVSFYEPGLQRKKGFLNSGGSSKDHS